MESKLGSLRFEATAAAGLDLPAPSTVSPLLSADAALTNSLWRFGLLAAFSFGSSTLVLDDLTGRERGTLTTRAVFVLPHAMVCLERTISLCGGLRAGARIAIGSAAGPYLFQTRTVLAPTPTTGLGGRVAFGLGSVLFALDLSLLINLTTTKLELQGLQTSVETPRFDLLLTLAAGGRTR
ncbi:MAG: hypothetical protein JNM69_34295 [Archangium sp.]|nr:hypothetical protein [Archangium sp.]